ncbi:MAG TPA: lytic transglycosylase domain-containing protein [Candidatus Solibacter sp.]|nr:lytic transglycosylase domain-containing protein [Candidatus Solibacter sp.]
MKKRKNTATRRFVRWIGPRGLLTIALGATLSIGGLTQALDNVHFVVLKDLDAVRVVRQEGQRSETVAKLSDGFAANSFFKLSRALPESVVSHRIALFDDRWLPDNTPAGEPRSVFHEEMKRINGVIRRDFFANAVPFGGLIHDKARKYDVDPALVAAVVETESRFKTRARSQVGATGLMQLMPRTGRWMGANNLYDPEQNVEAGTKYLRYLNQRFDGNLKKTIAAYNAGEGNVRRYNGIPPFNETRSYVKKVMSRYEERKKQMETYHGPQEATAELAAR